MKARGWIILGITAAVLTGVGIWGWNQYKKLMDYCFNFTSYKIRKIGFKQIIVDLVLTVKNKSAIPIRITDYSFDVKLDGQFITRVTDPLDRTTGKPREQLLSAGALSDLVLSVDFNPGEVLKATFSPAVIQGILTDFESVKFQVSGWIGINGIKKVNVPVIDFTLKDVMPEGQPSPPCQ